MAGRHRPSVWTPGIAHDDLHVSNVMFRHDEPDCGHRRMGDDDDRGPLLDLGRDSVVVDGPGRRRGPPGFGHVSGRVD